MIIDNIPAPAREGMIMIEWVWCDHAARAARSPFLYGRGERGEGLGTKLQCMALGGSGDGACSPRKIFTILMKGTEVPNPRRSSCDCTLC